jgi:hypothetical protein
MKTLRKFFRICLTARTITATQEACDSRGSSNENPYPLNTKKGEESCCGELVVASPQLALHFLMKANRSPLICSAFVVGMPCGKPG